MRNLCVIPGFDFLARIAIIDCRDPVAFARAHMHAVSCNEISFLTGSLTGRLVPEIMSEYRNVRIYSDRPSETNPTGASVVSIAELPILSGLSLDPESDAPVAVFFTSGSTGQPHPVVKSARALFGEARSIVRALGLVAGADLRVIATVPLHHMFGYMFGFLIPSIYELAVNPLTVVYPADLATSLAASRIPAWIVTTPTHLRLYLRSSGTFNNIARLVCGTSPLHGDLAEETLRIFNAPVIEFYGSTETGAVAMREWHGGLVSAWHCLPGVDLSMDGQNCAVISGLRFNSPVRLTDTVEFHGDGSFSLLGRDADLIKVAGKRASLVELNRILLSAPDVHDGAFYVPDDTTRLVAFVSLAPKASREGVLAHLRANIEAVFLPRPLYEVAQLPRGLSGKLSGDGLLELYRTLKSRHHADTPCCTDPTE
jgi:4-coumarate--CoA ligase (photoactive yellow protein activation family)